MKLFKSILAAAAIGLTALSTVPAQAADTFFWAGTGTGSSTVSYAVIPHTGKSLSGQPVATPLLTYLNATTDTNGAVQFFNCGVPAVCNFTNLGTTIFVNLTNSTSGGVTAFTNANGYNGRVLIYNKASGLFHVRTLGVATGATNLVTTVATTNRIGDLVWPLITAGTIPVNVTTKELNASAGGGGIYSGDPGEPLLFEIRGGTNCSINAASGRYP